MTSVTHRIAVVRAEVDGQLVGVCNPELCDRYAGIMRDTNSLSYADLPGSVAGEIANCDGVPCLLTTRAGREAVRQATDARVQPVGGDHA